MGGRSSRSHRVYVSDIEEAQLVQLAAAQHVTVPRLLVESALASGPLTTTDRHDLLAELFAVRRAIANTANNVNQIARAVNTDGRLPFDPGAVIDELRARLDRVDEVLEAVAGR